MSPKGSKKKSPSKTKAAPKRKPNAQLLWTKKERAAFVKKLRGFQERLPERQRKTFNRIMAGTVEAFRFGKSATGLDKDRTSFAQRLGTFREGLTARQREALTSMIAAGAVAWGAAGEDGKGDEDAIYMWHALLPALAIITVGVVLISKELSKGDDAEAPDLTHLPVPPD